jgi:hypothetical protein
MISKWPMHRWFRCCDTRTLPDQRVTNSIKSALAFSFISGMLNPTRIDFECGRETSRACG